MIYFNGKSSQCDNDPVISSLTHNDSDDLILLAVSNWHSTNMQEDLLFKRVTDAE